MLGHPCFEDRKDIVIPTSNSLSQQMWGTSSANFVFCFKTFARCFLLNSECFLFEIDVNRYL